MTIAGLILAGGLARRMGGGQKALLELDEQPLIGYAIETLSPQVGGLALNVNAEFEAFESFGLPLVRDTVEGFAGPLAGVLAGMTWAVNEADSPEWLLTVPTDAPFLPKDLGKRLLDAAADADVVVAMSAGRTHPVVALWRLGLKDALHQALVEDDIRKIDRFTAAHRTVHVEWPTEPFDPFFNINRPDDLEKATALLA